MQRQGFVTQNNERNIIGHSKSNRFPLWFLSCWDGRGNLHFAGADYVSSWSDCGWSMSQTASSHPSVLQPSASIPFRWRNEDCFLIRNLKAKKRMQNNKKCTDRSWLHMLVKNKALGDWHKPLLKGMWRGSLHGRKQVLLFYFVWDSSPFHHS